MGLQLKNVDRALEWAIRDQAILKGYWPANSRALITAGDDAGYQAAIDALTKKIHVFGTGNFKDRQQIEQNNIIISRITVSPGDLFTASPYYFKLKDDSSSYQKLKSLPNTWHIEYEIRFVADDVYLDRALVGILNRTFPGNAFIRGINDDLSPMIGTDEVFNIIRFGQPVDLSDENYIERVHRFMVLNVYLEDEDGDVIDTDNISPLLEATLTPNQEVPGGDVQYPEAMNDITPGASTGMADYVLSLIEDGTYFNKLKVIRMYAQDTEAKALRNIIPVRSNAVNSGLTFIPFKGFRKTASGQFLKNNFLPTENPLTSFFYSVFVTDVPDSGVFELFGLINAGASFYLRSDSTVGAGLQGKGNSNNEILLTVKAKPNTLYSLNAKNRLRTEIWENNLMIGYVETQPSGIPSGSFKELDINNQGDVSVGVSTAGGIALSCIGEGLQGREINAFYKSVMTYMVKIGLVK